jgi:GT2 family glycosyltransferase
VSGSAPLTWPGPDGSAVSGAGTGTGVGVVVATRDRARSLARTLEHLCSLPERPRVVVVDNGSQAEATGRVAEQAGLEVRLIRLERDLGPAARTVGVRALDTDLVAFCDDDSWWEPGSLSRAAALMRDHPRLGLLAARIVVGPERRLDPTCEVMARSPLPREAGLPGRPVLGFLACGAVVRRRPYLEVGGFERRFGFGGEETLLALDLAAAGWQLAYVEEIVAHHHPSARDEDGRRRRRELQLRNELWSAWLRRSLPTALSRTATLVIRGVRAGQGRALIAAARGLPWTLRERRVLPPGVERAARLLG